MKIVNYNGNEYHVNSPSKELKALMDKSYSKEAVLFQQPKPVFFYMHKNFQGEPSYLSDAIGILKNIKQPTRNQVQHAMIWSIGYDNTHYYSIKAGGESISDNLFTSCLMVTIAHPKTGLDTDVVILKKYSKNFEDVLITEKEVRSLYEKCKSPEETKKVNKTNVEGAIHLLLRSFRGLKINISGTDKFADKKTLSKIKDYLFEFGTKYMIEEHLNKLINRYEEYLKIELNEELSGPTTKEFHDNARKNIEEVNKFKLYLFDID